MPIWLVVTSPPQQLHSIDSLLEGAVALGASDLHLTVGVPPVARVRGSLRGLEGVPRLDADASVTPFRSSMSWA